MYKILENLYYTTLETEAPPAEYWKETSRPSEIIEQQQNILRDGMTPAQRELFENFLDTFSKREDIRMRYSFIAGFRLAVRIMAEALREES